jgi:hypothetical protein
MPFSIVIVFFLRNQWKELDQEIFNVISRGTLGWLATKFKNLGMEKTMLFFKDKTPDQLMTFLINVEAKHGDGIYE